MKIDSSPGKSDESGFQSQVLRCCVWCGVVCIKTTQKLDNTMAIISVCVEFHCGSLMAKTFQNSKVSTVESFAK